MRSTGSVPTSIAVVDQQAEVPSTVPRNVVTNSDRDVEVQRRTDEVTTSITGLVR